MESWELDHFSHWIKVVQDEAYSDQIIKYVSKYPRLIVNAAVSASSSNGRNIDVSNVKTSLVM